jgi:hypothetical protein
MLLELDYKGYRILVNAVAEGDCWHCNVMLPQVFAGHPTP